MSDVQGRCSACLKAGPEGFSRNFLCDECVHLEYLSTYCRHCKKRARFREEDAQEVFAPYIEHAHLLLKGAVAVLPYCSECQHTVTEPPEHGIIIIQAGSAVKEKTVPW